MTKGGTMTALGINKRGWQMAKYVVKKTPSEIKAVFARMGYESLLRGQARRLNKSKARNPVNQELKDNTRTLIMDMIV